MTDNDNCELLEKAAENIFSGGVKCVSTAMDCFSALARSDDDKNRLMGFIGLALTAVARMQKRNRRPEEQHMSSEEFNSLCLRYLSEAGKYGDASVRICGRESVLLKRLVCFDFSSDAYNITIDKDNYILYPLLIYAAQAGNFCAAALLCRLGAKADAKKNGRSALSLLAVKSDADSLKTAEVLLKSGASCKRLSAATPEFKEIAKKYNSSGVPDFTRIIFSVIILLAVLIIILLIISVMKIQ